MERKKRLQQEVMDCEFIELRKANGFAYPRIIGTVADVLKERREAEYRKILEKIRRDAVDVEVAKSIAIAKTLPLKKMPKKEVAEQNNVEKPVILELPKIALDSGTAVNKLMTFHVLRRLTEENAES